MANPNLVKQIQYYLSEDNLAQDQFFYKEVASNPYISSYIDNILSASHSYLSATKSRKWESPQSSKLSMLSSCQKIFNSMLTKLASELRNLKTYHSLTPRKKFQTTTKIHNRSILTTISRCNYLSTQYDLQHFG